MVYNIKLYGLIGIITFLYFFFFGRKKILDSSIITLMFILILLLSDLFFPSKISPVRCSILKPQFDKKKIVKRVKFNKKVDIISDKGKITSEHLKY